MGPKKSFIHMSAEEKLANSSQSGVDVALENSKKLDEVSQNIKDLHETTKNKNNDDIVKNQQDTNKKLEEIKDYIDHPEIVIRKLEEVKSAGLVNNKLLKEIRDKKIPEQKDFPTSMEVTMRGLSVITLKGDKGDSVQGEKGDKGESGENGQDGKNGKDGKSGKNGKEGRDGIDGKNGKDGKDGLDGSPDTPDEIVDKVNSSKKKIDLKHIKGLDEIARQVNEYGSNPQGYREAGGGGNVIRFLSNGVVVSAYVTELNFSTNITPVYDGNGRITLTATGGGGTTYQETPTGAINGSNKVYATTHAVTTVINFAINGQYIHPAEYSAVGTTITFVTALDSSLSGTGFTITYQ